MSDLPKLAMFAEVVRSGSLSAAARHLGISTSAVSQQLRALERAHKVTLLHRSTRKLTLTDAGLRLAEHCQAMVEAAERAHGQLERARDTLEGELRISVPAGFARHIAPALAPLLAQHPALRLRVLADDALIDLIDARIDLALRAGSLPDSGWVAQPLCAVQVVLCAAPSYLAGRGALLQPSDLTVYDWVAVGDDSGAPMKLELRDAAGATQVLRFSPRMTCNNQLTLHQLCAGGMGVAACARADVEDELRSGRLTVVLPAWKLASWPMWAVTPQRDGQPAKVRHAIVALHSFLRQTPGLEP